MRTAITPKPAVDPRAILTTWLPESSATERPAMFRLILAARAEIDPSDRPFPRAISEKIWHKIRNKPVGDEGLSFEAIVSRPEAATECLGHVYVERLLLALDDLQAKRAELEQQLDALRFLDSVTSSQLN